MQAHNRLWVQANHLSLPVLSICSSCGMSEAGRFSICASLGRILNSICRCPFSPALLSSPMKRSSTRYEAGCTESKNVSA